jgi:Leucine-rich repeat (LRR) protein
VQYNKENRIFDKDDMSLWELTHLSLSYKNIIEIDNLLGLDKLQRLQLDNNIICKI